jgi:hypothetical protein
VSHPQEANSRHQFPSPSFRLTIRPIVLTCITNEYVEPLREVFIKSLYEVAKFGGRLIVVSYGLSDTEIDSLGSMGVEVVRFQRDERFLVPIDRLRAFSEILYAQEANTPAAFYDGSDVYFQGPIDSLFEGMENDCLTASPEINPRLLRDNAPMCRWMGKCARGRVLRDSMIEANARVINGGFAAGPARLLAAYCSWAWEQATGPLGEVGGADQVVLTWASELRLWPFSSRGTETWNYTLCEVRPIIKDGVVFDAASQEIPRVIHRNGGRRTVPAATWRSGLDYERAGRYL